MNNERNYITICHLEDHFGTGFLKVKDELILKKEKDNTYDDEAIAVYKDAVRCGYVANSVCSVARGTLSAGRLYDRFEEEASCLVRFIIEDKAIAEVFVRKA